MDSRLADHFLWRLRRRAETDAIDHAVDRGILLEHVRTVGGREVRSFAPGPAATGKTLTEIARLLRHHGTTRPETSDEWDDSFDVVVQPTQSAAEAGTQGFAADGGSGTSKHVPDVGDLLRVVRQSAEPPPAVAVATLLLVAQSFTMSTASLDDVLAALRVASPIITLTGRVKGFEEAFIDLLGKGLVLPGRVARCKGGDLTRSYGFRFSNTTAPRWQVIVFTGDGFDVDLPETTQRQIAIAAESAYPILGVAEYEDLLPWQLKQAARINLTCGPLDMGIIRRTMRAVLGTTPKEEISLESCAALTLADLALAIRPGGSADGSLDLLEELARFRGASATAKSGGGPPTKESGRKKSGSGTSSNHGKGDPGSGGEVIQPVRQTGTERDAFIPRVETLTGYGEAKDWALALKDDLALWRTGSLAWEDMSVKLLLSGAPGTGKTMFARALCNTLQIPLIATSVATWMEPGYLGDCVKRMSAAFADAEAASPSILFIDEFDGIGTRGKQGEWSSYWNTIVNRALELLDGAAKSSGVIVVGATNDATVIDPALLRSGRLEKHIVIPRPNTEALIGILQHHLKSDLADVVASAPLIAGVDQRPEILTDTDRDTASADAPAASTITKPATEREVRTHDDV